MAYVRIVEPVHPAGIELLREGGVVPLLDHAGDEWRRHANEIVGVIVRGSKVDRRFLDEMPGLQVVGKHGVGIDTIDLEATAERGIVVTNTPDANAGSVAEHGMAMLAALTRNLREADSALRAAGYADRGAIRESTTDLSDSRLGIVGMGRIGRRIAQIGQAGYGLAVGAYDPYVDPKVVAAHGLDVTYFDEVGDLFDWADNVVIAAPLTPRTRGIVGEAELRRLGPDGVLVCVSRAGIVDEAVLAAALMDGTIRAAGVDVFEVEPPGPSNPLFSLRNVLVTPHMGGASPRSCRQMSIDVCANVLAVLGREPAPRAGAEGWLRSD